MPLTIDFTPEEGGRLREQAHQTDLPLGLYVQQIVKRAADAPTVTQPEATHEDPTLALFTQWDLEDATDEPEEIARRQRYLPLSTADVRLAAVLWAQARGVGRAGAPPEALDGDVLIAAQALRLKPAASGLSGRAVATVNVGH